MDAFVLQIHNNSGQSYDSIIIDTSFNRIVEDFDRKLKVFKKNGYRLNAVERPVTDEFDGSTHGMFSVTNTENGNVITVRVCDYHFI